MYHMIGRGIRPFSVLVLAAIVAAVFAATTSSRVNTAPILHFRVTGSFVSDFNGGALHSDAWGFTPNGNYVTTARYPNGKPYVGLTNPGTVDKLGHTSRWNWDCAAGANGKPDPQGIYNLKLKDITTGLSISAKLRVLPPRCEIPPAKNCNFTQP